MDSLANVETIKQDTEKDRLEHNNEAESPYQNIIIIDFDGLNVNMIMSKMEQWSILSNVINYVQSNSNPRDCYKLDVKALELKNHRKIYDSLKGDRQVIELHFGNIPGKLKGEYLDMYDGVRSEVLCTTKFDENSDLSTIYLGRIDMTRSDKIMATERFLLSGQGYTVGKLIVGTEC